MKGFAFDIKAFLIVAMLFSVIIPVLFGVFYPTFIVKMNDATKLSDVNPTVYQKLLELGEPPQLLAVAFMYSMMIASIILAFFVRPSPIFIPLLIILLFIFVWASMFVSNIHEQFVTRINELGSKEGITVRINWIYDITMRNLPVITSVYGVALLIALFSKFKLNREQAGGMSETVI